jgi:hypothetical protein
LQVEIKFSTCNCRADVGLAVQNLLCVGVVLSGGTNHDKAKFGGKKDQAKA